MTSERARIGRLGTAAAWISAVCCLPYLFLKVVWTLDVPVGVTDRSMLHSSGWVAANALMAVMQLVGLLLVLALTRPWARRVPPWLLLFPVWVGTGLLFQVTIGSVLAGIFSASSETSGESTGGIQPWVYVMVYASFAGQGTALAIAFACYVRSRWSRLLGARTGEVIQGRAAVVRSWPEHHVVGMTHAAAAMAVAVAVVFGYWAAGGTVGLSSAQPPSSALQASRAIGAVTAAVGLLGLTGSWGQRTRLWLPTALVWLGSGAVVAFDALMLVLNRLLMFGADASEPGWSLADSLTVLKILIGLAAAAAGVVALTAAAKRRQRPGEGEQDSSEQDSSEQEQRHEAALPG